MPHHHITFKKDAADQAFQKDLYQRIEAYFKENNLAKTGNSTVRIKAIILVSLFLVGNVCLLLSTTVTLYYLTCGMIGVLTISVALNIAHDAAHNTFSKSKKLNNILLFTFDLLGANGYIWRMKHVYSHHPHVNIPNMDGDIKQSNLVRIFPNAKFLKFHRYQYLYMPVLYLCYTMVWLMFRDFRDFFDTQISGKPGVKHPLREYVKLFIGKMLFFIRMIGLPLLILPFSLGQVLIGFVIFHVCASLTVAMALISAHIGEDSVYPEPDDDGQMEHSWVRHQIVTTCDFSTKSPLITHLFGGFNHHIIHHLCPHICHIHYPPLTEILRKTCLEYQMPYNVKSTLWDATVSHMKFLIKRSKQGIKVDYIEM